MPNRHVCQMSDMTLHGTSAVLSTFVSSYPASQSSGADACVVSTRAPGAAPARKEAAGHIARVPQPGTDTPGCLTASKTQPAPALDAKEPASALNAQLDTTKDLLA